MIANAQSGPQYRYEGLLRQLPVSSKDTGSITLGTPVQENMRKKHEVMNRGDMKQGYPMYDHSAEALYKRMSPNAMSSTYPPYSTGHMRPSLTPQVQSSAQYPNYDRNVLGHPKANHPPATQSDIQQMSHQIMIDFKTSKQMQTRRGSISERDIRPSSPSPLPSALNLRSHDSSSPQMISHHRMPTMGPPYSNAALTNQFKQNDLRYPTSSDRSMNPNDRQQSPSAGWNKHSPNQNPYQMVGSPVTKTVV